MPVTIFSGTSNRRLFFTLFFATKRRKPLNGWPVGTTLATPFQISDNTSQAGSIPGNPSYSDSSLHYFQRFLSELKRFCFSITQNVRFPAWSVCYYFFAVNFTSRLSTIKHTCTCSNELCHRKATFDCNGFKRWWPPMSFRLLKNGSACMHTEPIAPSDLSVAVVR